MRKRKHYTDKERFDTVKHFKTTGYSIARYAREHNIAASTLQDWVRAYNHIAGDFIRIDNINEDQSVINGKNVKMNLLRKAEIVKKSTHFSRFDHSIVVIEVNDIKVTTSLKQALAILERFYDRL
ncbi:MAG: transposase [Bacilli bacterium]|jgi:transposase-like protein